MGRKFCRTVKGKKRCVKNKPQMNAREIVKLQMNALKNNGKESGIRMAYKFASNDNKKTTGPYLKFKKMVRNETYKHLLNCKKWKFLPGTVRKVLDEIYTVDIEVLSSHDNKKYIYTFTLSRQIKTLYWRTDSVILKHIEGLTAKEAKKLEMCEIDSTHTKNVLGNKLEICGTNPMTGWLRDGYCNTDDNDKGTHTVCSTMTKEFLDFTKSKGNDLTTPSDKYDFPGLKPGDKWCLCALRWKEAYDENPKFAPPINIPATHHKTKDYIDLNILKQHMN